MHRDVAFVKEDAFVSECIDILVGRRITGLPVVDQQRTLVGIVSQTDLIRHEKELLDAVRGMSANDGSREAVGLLAARRVREVMTRRVVYADESASLHDLADTMLSRGIHRLLVTADRKVVGIVSSMDVAGVLLRQAAAVRRGMEFRHEYSHIYSNKHERLVLRLEHIERLKTLVKLHASQRGPEASSPLSVSDVVNACLDFVFEHPIDFRRMREPEQLRELIAEEICARVACDLRDEAPASQDAGQSHGIWTTRPAPATVIWPPQQAGKAQTNGRTKDDEGTWPPRKCSADAFRTRESAQPSGNSLINRRETVGDFVAAPPV